MAAPPAPVCPGSLPRPKAILVVSARWESAPLPVSAPRPSELVEDGIIGAAGGPPAVTP
ncbi:hypothetical protein ABC795_09430 [Blastococcus sp. HT6-30]|uniref:hypothetical protein n=1 Tax=Blastococcus sp. HT6-30 TaxID=3144843 RepID=UPI00321A43CE